jgi:hypothetical protein
MQSDIKMVSLRIFNINIAIARQIFQNKIFFSLPGEVFLIKKRKSFYEKFAGRQQYHVNVLNTLELLLEHVIDSNKQRTEINEIRK